MAGVVGEWALLPKRFAHAGEGVLEALPDIARPYQSV